MNVVHQAFMLSQFGNMIKRKVEIYQMLSGRVSGGKKLEHHRSLYEPLLGHVACHKTVSEDEARTLVWDVRGIKVFFDTNEPANGHGHPVPHGDGPGHSRRDEIGAGPHKENTVYNGGIASSRAYRSYNVVLESELRWTQILNLVPRTLNPKP